VSSLLGEEVDEQSIDAFGLIMMNPVGRVRQELDAVEVGHVFAVGLREFGAEVGVALPPDDERRPCRENCCEKSMREQLSREPLALRMPPDVFMQWACRWFSDECLLGVVSERTVVAFEVSHFVVAG